jgi:tRNA 5-methylaminomethyl-2-thiouridine biosynthesis bifunctional protein
LVFGASSEPGQHAIELCPAAQQANWVRLMRLRSGHTQGAEGLMGIAPAGLTSRAGVRWSTADKLPLVGPVPDWLAVSSKGNIDASTSMRSRAGWEQVRHVPRAPGLYLHTGLGSRGITWCALTAQLLAARITNTTWPLEASLVDAIDPARAVSRAVRQGLL